MLRLSHATASRNITSSEQNGIDPIAGGPLSAGVYVADYADAAVIAFHRSGGIQDCVAIDV